MYLAQVTNNMMIIPTLSPDQLTLDNPDVKKIVSALDVLLTWTKIHESILERYESKNYFGF